jgi:hypothetical protein
MRNQVTSSLMYNVTGPLQVGAKKYDSVKDYLSAVEEFVATPLQVNSAVASQPDAHLMAIKYRKSNESQQKAAEELIDSLLDEPNNAFLKPRMVIEEPILAANPTIGIESTLTKNLDDPYIVLHAPDNAPNTYSLHSSKVKQLFDSIKNSSLQEHSPASNTRLGGKSTFGQEVSKLSASNHLNGQNSIVHSHH